jgi:tetratricopeptide (TPR) repeat protein
MDFILTNVKSIYQVLTCKTTLYLNWKSGGLAVTQGIEIKTHIKKASLLVLSLSILSSCSWVTSGRSLFGDEPDRSDVIPSRDSVPKEQYQQLLEKYEKLLSDHKKVINKEDTAPAPDTKSLLKNLSNTTSKPEPLAETVDVFKSAPKKAKGLDYSIKTTPVIESTNYDQVDVEGQITQLRKAKVLVGKRRFDSSFKILKDLERSPVRQVRVRAKFQLGEILFSQQEYDLSMQIFEEIIHNDAFSGIVIKTLGRPIVCSEKLKLDKKKEQYYSMLHDFFESA